jgi:hypothetical protein
MKKLLAILAVMALVAPAMAATITFGTPTPSAGQVSIPWTADAAVVGMGITVEATSGVVDSFTVDSFFDVFVDVAWFEEQPGQDGYTMGEGSGADNTNGADQTQAGKVALPSALFSISVGGLDDDGIGEGTEEAPTSGSIILKSDAGATVDLGEDTLRGGVVGYDGAMTIAGLPTGLAIPAGECITSSHEDYSDWVSVGKPDSWCWTRQCHGDGDNAQEASGRDSVWVGYNDVTVLLSGFKELSPTAAMLAGDYNRRSETSGRDTVRVGYDDVAVLLEYFKDLTVPDDCLNDDHVNP